MRRIGIVCKSGRSEPADILKDLLPWLRERGVEIFVEPDVAIHLGVRGYRRVEIADLTEIMVVLGGDGTMLSVARQVCEKGLPILGVNLGGLGFITEVKRSELRSAIERILSGNYRVEDRLMLTASIIRDREIVAEYPALNDVVITKGALARIIDLETHVDKAYVTTFSADGLIISTPTGSTAYCLSAGGPILYTTLDCVVLIPICPHTLSNRPIVLPGDALIEISLKSFAEDVFLTIDGQMGYELRQHDVVAVSKSPYKTKMIIPYERDYFQVLRTKLGWGEGTQKNSRERGE